MENMNFREEEMCSQNEYFGVLILRQVFRDIRKSIRSDVFESIVFESIHFSLEVFGGPVTSKNSNYGKEEDRGMSIQYRARPARGYILDTPVLASHVHIWSPAEKDRGMTSWRI